MKKRILATLLSLCLVLTLLPTVALADEGDVAQIEGGSSYSSLADAISNAQDGDTVKLLKNANGDGIKIKAKPHKKDLSRIAENVI